MSSDRGVPTDVPMFTQRFAKEEGGIPPWIKYAIIAAAVAVSGYVLYAAWTKGDHSPIAFVICADPKCGYVEERSLQVGEDVPQKCPKCGKQTFYPGFPCRGCKTPLIWNENRRLPPPTKCPKCGMENWHGK